jgi:hypothetical protein
MESKLQKIALFCVKTPSTLPRKRRNGCAALCAGFLAVALSLAGCDSLNELLDLGEDEAPKPIDIDDTYIVTFGTGNGGGTVLPVQQSAGGGEIKLPEPDSFTAPTSYPNMKFAGWHDGTLTYAAGDTYTVTGNVAFQARWGFTTSDDIQNYLDGGDTVVDKDGNILLVLYDEVAFLTSAELEEMITGKNIELDLSASALGVTAETFDLSTSISAQKLLLPRAAKSTTGSYKGTAQEVSGLNVTTIGDGAFSHYASLKKANFPNAITIGSLAFDYCYALEKADFPVAKNIGKQAFYRSTALKTANIPLATTIGQEAFGDCYALGKADIPLATIIGAGAFYNCKLLETVDFPLATDIGYQAFMSCAVLETVDFPEVITIGEQAFYGCSALETTDFPEVITIGQRAFYGCSALKTADFPKVTATGQEAFYYCNKLEKADFPEAITIGASAFYYCYAFKRADFPEVTTIGQLAFYYCSALETVDFPLATTIDGGAFFSCSKLKEADFPLATGINNSRVFYGCTSLETANFPLVTVISYDSFYGCTSLTTITIGPSCNIDASSSNTIPGNFKEVYNVEKAAGTYTRADDGTWSKTAG